jgi:cyclin A
MASFEFYTDQENAVPGGIRRQNKEARGGGVNKGQVQGTRSVLGEISNVTRRQASMRAAKQAIPSFPIFHDDENSLASTQPPHKQTLHRSKGSAWLPGLGDKENAVPASRNFKLEDVVKKSLPDPPKMVVRKHVREQPVMSSSDESFMDEEGESSPMVLDTSHQQWRVPPLSSQGETVDIFTAPEYSQDIYNYLRETEHKHLAKWNYMGKQPDITQSMRSILVDWLVEVSEEYKLQTETLYLAVNYIDRFLSVMSVQRAKLQLVGTAAMFIASKYEEIYPPDVSEFVYITDDTYNKRQVLRMEHLVLKVLGFDVSVPTSHLFVSKLSEMAGSDERTTSFAMYLNELSLMSGDFLQFSPSTVAAASVALARHTLGQPAWPQAVTEGSGYSVVDIQACLLALHESHVAAEDCPQQAIREKYKASKHHGVSEIVPAILARSL